MLPPTQTLVKYAALSGFATITMGMLYYYKLQEKVAATPYYKEALKTVRTHKGAVYILGEPIKALQRIEVGNSKLNYTTDLSARYEVPIKGTKERGTVYLWARRKSTEDEWTVNRIELGLAKEPNRRLLVKNEEE